MSRGWTEKGHVHWASFGFYAVGDTRKPLKDFKHRVIMAKCVFPG